MSTRKVYRYRVTLDFEKNQTASIKTASSSAKTKVYSPFTSVEYKAIKDQEK